ncbi:Spore germination protein GerE [Nocardioides aquaticus]|uniref:Spore germination protein GerE n=1 Tax=Nocardioides aquaticus TaxID=160826 RepID=A0ABX8EHP7_9ACTN|nr:LuxR C-terminal-related transcriptional regulator [Nocardioides aquaticus]QVT79789.1 Spore germination protein GerE [Nocardioides aquaticus]
MAWTASQTGDIPSSSVVLAHGPDRTEDAVDAPTTPCRIRVSVLSPSVITRTGLRALLARHPDRIEVLDDADDTDDADDPCGAPSTARTAGADVLVLDVAALKDPTRRSAVETVMAGAYAVVAVAEGFRADLPVLLRGTGVAACLSPDVTAPDLVATVEAAGTGDLASTDVADGQGTGALRFCRGTDRGLGLFSSREHEVVAHIVGGRSNAEIAGAMFLSSSAVKSCIRSAYRKMGVSTRPEAIVWLLREGIGFAQPEASHLRDAT